MTPARFSVFAPITGCSATSTSSSGSRRKTCANRVAHGLRSTVDERGIVRALAAHPHENPWFKGSATTKSAGLAAHPHENPCFQGCVDSKSAGLSGVRLSHCPLFAHFAAKPALFTCRGRRSSPADRAVLGRSGTFWVDFYSSILLRLSRLSRGCDERGTNSGRTRDERGTNSARTRDERGTPAARPWGARGARSWGSSVGGLRLSRAAARASWVDPGRAGPISPYMIRRAPVVLRRSGAPTAPDGARRRPEGAGGGGFLRVAEPTGAFSCVGACGSTPRAVGSSAAVFRQKRRPTAA